MTISKVIEHEEEIAKGYEEFTAFCINPTANSEIIEYHRQLAEWLRELKAYREARKEINGLATVWEEGEGINKCSRILFKHLEEVNADDR